MTEVSTAQPGVLSQAQIDEFHERGILQVDFGFAPGLLETIKTRVYPHYPADFRNGKVDNTRLQDAWKCVDEARQLAADPRVLAALEQLLGRKALPFQTLNFPVGTRQLAHSDTIHFSTLPAGYMAGVWVALEDIDADNGPLIYYPGSQKLPYYGMHDFELEPGYHNYHIYEQRIQELIEKEGFEPEYGTIKKGQAIIWHANVLHGGAPQKDMSRSRHSQVTHYYFDGCKYYTPMESTADEKTYRQPEWITNQPYQMPEQPGILRRVLRKLGVAT